MLPFQFNELKRFGFSLITLKFVMLLLIQTVSFRRANGMIFLSDFARRKVQKVTGELNCIVIPHGIDDSFRNVKKVDLIRQTGPITLLYVSIIDHYKHQWKIVEYTANLRKKTGIDFKLRLIGNARPSALNLLEKVIKQHDEQHTWVDVVGQVDHRKLVYHYADTDIAIFASTCENLPNILIEKMASGLPIVSTSVGPMKETLQDGIYLNDSRTASQRCYEDSK